VHPDSADAPQARFLLVLVSAEQKPDQKNNPPMQPQGCLFLCGRKRRNKNRCAELNFPARQTAGSICPEEKPERNF